MAQREFEILVVGAGPAGSWTAQRLATDGHGVALIDENEGPRPEVICSGIVSLEAFDRFELPRESVVDTITRVRFFSPAGREVSYEPERPLAHVVDRTRFDGGLTERAVAAGACLLRGRSARSVRVSRGRVELGVRANGGHEVFRGRALVVATGYRSQLHAQAGLGRPPAYVQGVHLETALRAVRDAELYFGSRLAPGFFAWAVPLGAGRARLGLIARRHGRVLLQNLVALEAIHGRIHPSPRGPSGACAGAECGGRVTSRGIVQGPVVPSVADRVLAVGEAAGQVKTTTGGGLYYGLIGADLAAEVLSRELRSGRSSVNLYRYQKGWMERLGREIRSGLRLQSIGARMEDGQIDELFSSLQDGLGGLLRSVVRFDWHRPVLQLLFRTSPLAQAGLRHLAPAPLRRLLEAMPH